MAEELKPWDPTKTKNLHVRCLDEKCNKFKVEISLSQSANDNDFKSFDKERFISYANHLKDDLSHFQKQEDIDTPEYHGARVYELGEPVTVGKVENMAINDLVDFFGVFQTELRNCASSRMTMKFKEPDYNRLVAIVDKLIIPHIEDYMAKYLPLDLPETSPGRAAVGDGAKGLEPS